VFTPWTLTLCIKTEKVVLITLAEDVIAYNQSLFFLRVILNSLVRVEISRSLLERRLAVMTSFIASFNSLDLIAVIMFYMLLFSTFSLFC
jgi:hypothetical protein